MISNRLILSITASVANLVFLSTHYGAFAQNVGINTDGSAPDNSAMLDIKATDRGLLIPRVSLTNVTVAAPVTSPATGLLVFNTNASVVGGNGTGFYYWTGTQWSRLDNSNSADWRLTGNSGTNPATNFLGTTDAVDLVIRTNNTERARVTSGGNVGIGTTNPTERLHVAGNLRLDNAFMPGNNAGTAGSLLRSAGAGNPPVWIAPGANGSVLTMSGGLPTWSSPNGLFWGLTGNSGTNPATNFLGTTDAQDLVIRTNNTERARVTSGGNVGIGTNNPGERLHVVGTSRFDGIVDLKRPSDATNAAILQFFNTNTGNYWHNVVRSGDNDKLQWYRWSGNWLHVMTMALNGNVGIGTTDPTERLHVAGNLRLDNAFMPNNNPGTAGSLLRSAGAGNAPVWIAPGANGSVLTMSGGLPTWSSPNGLFWGLTGNSGTNPATNFLGTTDAQDLVIRTNNTERVRVTSGGNVGIGITTPNARLHVHANSENATRIAQETFQNIDGAVYTELAHDTWSSSFGILFNAYRATPGVNGYLFTTGNTKYKYSPGTFSRAAAAIGGYLNSANGGHIMFFSAPPGTADSNITWTTTGWLSRDFVWLSPRGINSDFYISNSAPNQGNVGIGITNPTERLHVAGNLRLDNAFMPGNNAGTAGSLLRSAGAGNAPVWIAPGANGSVLTMSGGLPTWSSPNGLFWGLTGNSGTNPATNFLGTTDNQPLVIRTNNSERVRVTSGGNVGIGVTAPWARLDINATGMAGPGGWNKAIHFSATNHSAITLTNGSGNGLVFGLHGNNEAFYFGRYTGNGSVWDKYVMDIYANQGYVGIGTNGVMPLTNLEVRGADAGSIVHNVGQSRGGLWALSNQRVALATTTASDDIVFGYGGAPVTSSNFVEYMRIDNATGHVGIGTTAPTERLHVAGNLRLDNAFMPGNNAGTAGSLLRSAGAGNAPVWIAPGANGSVLTMSGGLPTWSSPNGLFWGLTGNSGTNPATNFLGTTDAVDLVIRTTNIERARVTSAGNVGIGTTAPQHRLHVVNNVTGSAPVGSSARFDNTAVGWSSSQAIYARTEARFSTTIWSELNHTDGFVGAGFFYASPTPGAGTGAAIGVAGTTRQAGGSGVVGFIDYNSMYLSAYAGNSAVCGYNTGNTIYTPCVGVRGTGADVNDARGVMGTSYGLQTNNNRYAVFGEADRGANSAGTFWHVGVYGRNPYSGTNDWAVYAAGRFGASGTKSFMIDHPLDPDNKFLFHFSAEGPEPYNIYRGIVVTDENGYAEVELPAYFSAANKEPSYYLTPMGTFAQAIVEKKVQNNRFSIRTDKPNVEVSWIVISTRDDAYARYHWTPTEVEKSPEHRGKYINPLVYGKSIDESITSPDNAPFIVYSRDGKREKYIRGKLVESISIPGMPSGDTEDIKK